MGLEMATDGLVGPLDADATAKTSVQAESLCCCSILFIVLFFGDLMNSSDVGAVVGKVNKLFETNLTGQITAMVPLAGWTGIKCYGALLILEAGDISMKMTNLGRFSGRKSIRGGFQRRGWG